MKITFDPHKREKTVVERQVDFLDAAKVFENGDFKFQDTRKDYGEKRMIAVGYLKKRMVIIVYVDRGESRQIISMRKANAREIKRYQDQLKEV